jgi:hypothetical protein
VPANYLEPDAAPPQRLDNDAPPPNAKEDAVREVIDRQLKDLTAEEREIWFEELKGVPPGIVDDLLSVRRQFSATKPKLPTDMKVDESVRVLQPQTPSSPRPEWSAAIRAMRQARDIHLHNLANVHSPGYKRLVPVLAPLASPTDSPSSPNRQWGSQWQGVRQDDQSGEVDSTGRTLERSNVDPDAEWREVERIDRWLEAVMR